MSENIEPIANLFKVNWSGKWLATTPTFKRTPNISEPINDLRSGTNYILYDAGDLLSQYSTLNHQYISRYHQITFRLISDTKTTIRDMYAELNYIRDKFFYPAPWVPSWTGGSEILCHLNCNEGTGTTVTDSSATAWVLTFDTTDPPSWVTTGVLNIQKNYLLFAGDAATHDDFMASATEFPAHLQVHTAISFELLVKLVSGFYTALSTNIRLFANSYADDFWKLELLSSGNKLKYTSENGTSTYTLTAGYIPENKWTSIMVTHGARGMEIYVDGICQGIDTTNTQMPTGDSDVLHIGDAVGSHANCDFQLSRFQVKNVQALPYDSLTIGRLGSIEPYPGNLYAADINLQGVQQGIYVGGNL